MNWLKAFLIGGGFALYTVSAFAQEPVCRYVDLQAGTPSPVIDRNGVCQARVQCGTARPATVHCRVGKDGLCPPAGACYGEYWRNQAQAGSPRSSGDQAPTADPAQ